jgi:hypothetical protein
VLANDHSTPVIVRWAIMRTRGSLNPAGALDSLKGNSSLLMEGGKLTYGFLRVSRFLVFYESL